MRAMRRQGFIASAVAAILLTACGSGGGGSDPSSSGNSPGNGGETSSPAQAVTLIVGERVDSERVVTRIDLIKRDGGDAGGVDLLGAEWPIFAGTHHVFFMANNAIKKIDVNGTVDKIADMAVPNMSPADAIPSHLGLVASPDDSRVAYGYPTGSTDGGSYGSRIFIADGDNPPLQIVDQTADPNGFLVPFAWTAEGIWVAHVPYGINAIGPFPANAALMPVIIDPGTGKAGPIRNDCKFADARGVRPSGATVCFTSDSKGVQVTIPGASPRTVSITDLPAGTTVGDLVVSDKGRLALGTATNDPTNGWRYGSLRITTHDGLTTILAGPAGTRPVAWIDERTLLVLMVPSNGLSGATLGTMDLATGKVTQISKDVGAAGILH